MKYITLNDLTNTIRNNISKVPRDIDFIIGIPRSGMIVASIISEFLNLPLIDIDSFISGAKPTGGDRLGLIKRNQTNRVLVIDDTVNSGKSIKSVKEKLKDYEYEFVYMVAYLEGNGVDEIDVWLEDVRRYATPMIPVLYEWNIFHHYPHIMMRCMYDIDGVFCLDPPDENLTELYESYIKNATPLIIPSVPVGKIVTYRLIKYKEETMKWLADNGVRYSAIFMFNAQSWKERNDTNISPEQFKSMIYANDNNAILFVESDEWQAREIHRMTGKPVLCIETNTLYGGE